MYIEVYVWMTHLAICYITLFHDVTTSQSATLPLSQHVFTAYAQAHAFELHLFLSACLFMSFHS